MSAKTTLITGGAGFIGAALVRSLLKAGEHVRVLDDESRGSVGRLQDIRNEFEFIPGDVRDANVVHRATKGADCVCHLAFINGTAFFYTKPDIVLDVAVKGMANVIDACARHGVGDLVLASSSEVYQTPPCIPTDESAPLSIPDPLNPRYSYAAGKIISEMMAINYGRTHFNRVVIFRPHNVYGPDMGRDHVLPQFALRMLELTRDPTEPLRFPIQGTGRETRAFVFINDFIDGLGRVIERGEHLGIYHIGTVEEVTIEAVAQLVGGCFGRRVVVVPGEPAPGATVRRCPDIGKLARLGYSPKVRLRDGLPILVDWYVRNSNQRLA